MAALDSLKRAPKWAWWTAGGLAIGGAGIKLWRDRAKPEDAAADPASITGEAVSVGGGAPGAGVIVPPVIIPASDDGTSQVVGLFAEISDAWQSVLGSALGVDDAYAAVYMPVADLLPTLITQNANAGGPPPAGNVIVNIPQPTPAPAPAPSAPAPAPHAPSAPAPDPCTGEYPNQSSQGCYKVVCASGHGDHAKGRWHYYKNGRQVHVSNTC